VLLHPGSGSPKKNWPLEYFQELAQRLNATGLTTAFTHGPAEDNLPLENCLPPMSLPDLARTLASAHLYIGNDTGITHLAAAVGTPTLALFGPTNPTVWAPRGPHVHVLQRTPWPTPSHVHQFLVAAGNASSTSHTCS
jgi:ADP-heptose:LPS heptosyltransferase